MNAPGVVHAEDGNGGRVECVFFPVVCAWCEARGIRTVVGYTTVYGSHGICNECAEQMVRDAVELRTGVTPIGAVGLLEAEQQ